ncbi:RnfH family protein [Aeromonas salmonicida]|uniref:RnfH family protein n=1 Tax=Aeromonas salmonicida TaxID=645 RepID=UPI00223EFB22|nr:RnfH family protein [Aeromonas salmonicida]
MSDLLNIEVVYALPERQTVQRIRVAPETSVLAAIEQSGIVQKHPEIDLSVNKFGIYSRPVKGSELLQDGDRIEIYRPLIADPKEMRKKRAEKAKEEGRADVVTGGRPNTNRKRGDADSA